MDSFLNEILTSPVAMTESALNALLEGHAQLMGQESFSLSAATLEAKSELKAQVEEDDGDEKFAVGYGNVGRVAGSVAEVPIYGPISKEPSVLNLMLTGSSFSTSMFAKEMRTLASRDDVDTIVVDVNSNGGSIDGVETARLALKAAGEKKKTIAIANNNMNSAALWIASAANELVVSPLSFTGSIGVITVLQDRSEQFEKAGVKHTVIRSGEYKALNTPMEQNGEKLVQETVERVKDIHSFFVEAVADGRNESIETINKIANGKVFMAKQATEVGLADRLATKEDIMAEIMGDSPEETAENAVSVITAFSGEVSKLTAKVETLMDTVNRQSEQQERKEAEAVVDSAIKAGKIAAGTKEANVERAMKMGVDEYKDLMASIKGQKLDQFSTEDRGGTAPVTSEESSVGDTTEDSYEFEALGERIKIDRDTEQWMRKIGGDRVGRALENFKTKN